MTPLRVTHNAQTNMAYVYLAPIEPGGVRHSLEIAGRALVLDFDAEGRLLGIEFLAPSCLHPATLACARAPDSMLAKEAEAWDSGRLKPTDPGWVLVDPGTGEPQSKPRPPTFETEADEAAFWAAHDTEDFDIGVTLIATALGGTIADTTKCPHCEEPIVDGEDTTHPVVNTGPWHRECAIRAIVGSVGHQIQLCSCFPARLTPWPHPGEHVTEYLHAELAEKTGIAIETVDGICAGTETITLEIAAKLGLAFGRPTGFWWVLQQRYTARQSAIAEGFLEDPPDLSKRDAARAALQVWDEGRRLEKQIAAARFVANAAKKAMADE